MPVLMMLAIWFLTSVPVGVLIGHSLAAADPMRDRRVRSDFLVASGQ